LQKSCWYCHRPLSLFKSFKGELFCDSEHEKLYLSEQFKRVQEPFAPKPAPPKAEAESEPPAPEPAAASPAAALEAEQATTPAPPPVQPEPEPLIPHFERRFEPEHIESVEPVASDQIAFEKPPTSAEPVEVRSETYTEPPVAPLFAWPVNASQGSSRALVPEEQLALTPQRVNPVRAELAELSIVPPAAGLIASAFDARPGTQRPPVGEDAIIAIPARALPRMGENSRLAVTRDDFPRAASVATPVRASKGFAPQVQPEQPIALIPDRIDPSASDPNRSRAELSYGSATRMQLRSRRPPVPASAIPAGAPKLTGTVVFKQIPRLSFGATPQPGLTPAVSSGLTPVAAAGIDAGIAASGAIPPLVAFRTPSLAAFEIDRKLDQGPARTDHPSTRDSAGFAPVVPSATVIPSQIAVRIPKASAFESGWKRVASFTVSQIERKDSGGQPIGSVLEASLQLTLVSVATLGRTDVDPASTALSWAQFVSTDQTTPRGSEFESHVPEGAILAKPAAQPAGPAGALAGATALHADSYAALSEISCAGPGPQPICEAVAVTRHTNHVEFSGTLAGTLRGSVLHLTGLVPSLSAPSQDAATRTMPAVESSVIHAPGLRLAPALSGTAAIGAAASRVLQHTAIDSTESGVLRAHAQTGRPFDPRRPGKQPEIASPHLRIGTVALSANSADAPLRVLGALGQLRFAGSTSLPGASASIEAAELRRRSTIANSFQPPAKDQVPERARQQKARRAVPASLLGLPGAQPKDGTSSPSRGEALEMPVAHANPAIGSVIEAVPHMEIPARKRTAAVHFHLSASSLPEHAVIFNFKPVVQDHRRARRLAQAQARRHSPVALLAHPRGQDINADARFATAPEVPAATLP
jgi:hypothetical protein